MASEIIQPTTLCAMTFDLVGQITVNAEMVYGDQIGNTFRVLTTCNPDTYKWNAVVVTLHRGATSFKVLRSGPSADDRIVAMIDLLQSLEVSVTVLMRQRPLVQDYEDTRQVERFEGDQIRVKLPDLAKDVGISSASMVEYETVLQEKPTVQMAETDTQPNLASSEHNAVSSDTQAIGSEIKDVGGMNEQGTWATNIGAALEEGMSSAAAGTIRNNTAKKPRDIAREDSASTGQQKGKKRVVNMGKKPHAWGK